MAALVVDATPYAVARSYTTLLDTTAWQGKMVGAWTRHHAVLAEITRPCPLRPTACPAELSLDPLGYRTEDEHQAA